MHNYIEELFLKNAPNRVLLNVVKLNKNKMLGPFYTKVNITNTQNGVAIGKKVYLFYFDAMCVIVDDVSNSLVSSFFLKFRILSRYE